MGLADTVPGGMGAVAAPAIPAGGAKKGRPTKGGAWTQLGVGIGTGAAAGAVAGAPFAGVGAVVGAVVGAIIGAVPGAIAVAKSYGGGSTHEERMAKFSGALANAQQMNLPDAAFALRDAQRVLNEFQSLALEANQREQDPRIEAVYEASEPAARALSDAGNALSDAVAVYASGAESIDPWNLNNPALQSLREMPRLTLDVKNAMFPAELAVQDFKAVLANPDAAFVILQRGPVAAPLPPATFPDQGILRGWARIGTNSVEARSLKGGIGPNGVRLEYDGPPVGFAPSMEEWAQFDKQRGAA